MNAPWQPPQNIGDRSESIVHAKDKLRAYRYGQGLGSSDVYTAEFGVALLQFKVNRNEQILRGVVTGMPGMKLDSKLGWAEKKNLRILPEDLMPAKDRDKLPVAITINGHMGGMFDGLPYHTVRGLELAERIRVQPTGYDNLRKPFNNASGFNALDANVRALPHNVPWVLVSHSQGSVIECDYYEQVIQPNLHLPPFTNYRGGVRFGNPRRPKGVVASWIADPPPREAEGLDPNCLDGPTPGVVECSRDGDLYANKIPGRPGDYKEAVYEAVCRGRFIGANTLTAEIGRLATQFGNPAEIFAVFQAIVSGVSGLITLREHNEFDLVPATNHVVRVLGI